MDNIEYPFFRHYLEGIGDAPAQVSVLPSGSTDWSFYERWPADDIAYTAVYLREGDSLSLLKPSEKVSCSSYTSDPAHPVPHVGKPVGKRYREYMVEDQRFASFRPDVLTFVSPQLEDTLKLEGPVSARIWFKTTGSDADIVVKLIDVYPDDFKYGKEISSELPDPDCQMGGYQMLVRGDVFRARYREGFSSPVPVSPDEITEVEFGMDDIAHWFLPGHRLMIQIQSSWFPLVDMNPQNFVENIYDAGLDDYSPADISVLHQKGHPSHLLLPVKKQ